MIPAGSARSLVAARDFQHGNVGHASGTRDLPKRRALRHSCSDERAPFRVPTAPMFGGASQRSQIRHLDSDTKTCVQGFCLGETPLCDPQFLVRPFPSPVVLQRVGAPLADVRFRDPEVGLCEQSFVAREVCDLPVSSHAGNLVTAGAVVKGLP